MLLIGVPLAVQTYSVQTYSDQIYNSKRISDRIISLPCHLGIDINDVDFIVNSLIEILK